MPTDRRKSLGFVDLAEKLRADAYTHLPESRRYEYGQFLTPSYVARLMADFFESTPKKIRILDAGAGVGMLTAALLEKLLTDNPPDAIDLVMVEIEQEFLSRLPILVRSFSRACERKGVVFSCKIIADNFIAAAANAVSRDIFKQAEITPGFTHFLLNPPYAKINSSSKDYKVLSNLGISTGNLYSAFIWLGSLLLADNGEIVSINPRSFCNGPYFKPFRQWLFKNFKLSHIHLFEMRDTAFVEDGVLQENVILHLIKTQQTDGCIHLSSSSGRQDDLKSLRVLNYDEVVDLKSTDLVVHLPTDELTSSLRKEVERLPCSLKQLGLTVSTGRVVDFRNRSNLQNTIDKNGVPLIYPQHLLGFRVEWPAANGRKPNAIELCPQTQGLMVPIGCYVLVKRFSAKEESKRVSASILEADLFSGGMKYVGIENHLNYFHKNGEGLPKLLAAGLCAYLNSTLVDQFVRQFSGHTQVNASDLRMLKYPTANQLDWLGKAASEKNLTQLEIDGLITQCLDFMPESNRSIAAQKKISDALTILNDLELPKEQRNERSALTLLALLKVRPNTVWSDVEAPRLGITEMMDFFRDEYGKNYASNTRETVRRQTVHQFVQMGLVLENTDKPGRPVNSPHWNYQIEASAMELFRKYGSQSWDECVQSYKEGAMKLRTLQARERKRARIPVSLPDGSKIKLSPGGQNVLIKAILEDFCPEFTPGGQILYIGDAGNKLIVFEKKAFLELGLTFDTHGKMPDVVIYYGTMKWLVIIEAAPSHGPMDQKRLVELKALFSESKVGLVFVTAFPDNQSLKRDLAKIAWETDVWVADSPTHLIHFNGERFLGPYD